MKLPPLEKSPIDHHIQGDILRKLFASTEPLSFSVLKPGDIENSLFMYHMRKLEDRGVVIRKDKGFTLSPQGVQWVNFTSPNTLTPRLHPRLLINLLLTTLDEQKVLISERTSAAGAGLSKYLLPSGFHSYDTPIEVAACKLATTLLGAEVVVKYVGVYEIIHRYADGYVHHVMMPTFAATVEEQPAPQEAHYRAHWIAIDDIITNQEGHFDESLQRIVLNMRDKTPLTIETIIVNHTS